MNTNSDSSSGREVLSMNFDWRFHLGDIETTNYHGIHAQRFERAHWMKAGNHGISTVKYSDRDWRIVNLPHDFVVEGEISGKNEPIHGSLPTDIAWYRKTFDVSSEDEGKRFVLELDGVYRNYEVWCNGHFIGREWSGYASYTFDLSDVLEFGGQNTVAIRVDANDFELWSYEGGGIYRDARLVKTHAVHVPSWGTFVEPVLDESDLSRATLNIETSVRNDLADEVVCEIVSNVVSPAGELVASGSVEMGVCGDSCEAILQSLEVADPELWSPDTPILYVLETLVKVDGEVVDRFETSFGIRTIRVCSNEGFFLNGKNIKLKGVCSHQDHAGVGIAIPYALQEWRIHKMKSMGVNAIRTSHNPATPEMLEICDRLGVMVMDEARLIGTAPEYEKQLDNLVRRGRNHPSIVFWSLGNEDMLVQDTKVGIRMMRKMQQRVKRLDTSRPVTYAMNCDWIDICDLHEEEGFRLDVFGTNYRSGQRSENYDDFHAKYPDWPLVGSETGGSASNRGVYEKVVTDPPIQYHDTPLWTNPKRKEIISSYGETCTPWGYSIMETWKDCANRPFMMGTFLWTGFDYRGEIYPCRFPTVITGYGILDLCGFPKDAYWYYRAWWRDEPLLHVFPHWNWRGKEGEAIDVWCYTNCAEVELYLNGELLGRQSVEENGHLEWSVVYQPGKLEARGFDSAGEQILSTVHETTGEPVKVELIAERGELDADDQDLAPVEVRVLDAEGRVVPNASNLIRFSVTGCGRNLGVGNGDPNSHEPDKADQRHLYQGLCQILVQASREEGEVTLLAESDGLEAASVSFKVSGAGKAKPWVPSLLGVSDETLKPNPVDGAL
ncbi:beta-galactosidase GalA [Pelagicoccus mobilis]|uniref:DUF4982 domain-containing protein n=1 Tax=Pelagicoccus mobilis TaxID=415221 RepID=A0A934RXD1_9BACT|nr:beta-galactosidase GalA [Pelagicoccus mobilis]MBK1875313.1 DUF4982 domain-containing protein [Pelagicoccus mobilis]